VPILPAPPPGTVPELLDRLAWFDRTELWPHGIMRFDGMLKTVGDDFEPVEPRNLIESIEALSRSARLIIEAVARLGWQHVYHPEIEIGGTRRNKRDGSVEFVSVGRITLQISVESIVAGESLV
jgi:hypothetical protein